jgi:hypothetical protein
MAGLPKAPSMAGPPFTGMGLIASFIGGGRPSH